MPLAVLYAAVPVLLVQGRRVRRMTERLPDAGGLIGATGSGPDPLSLVVVGDSVAAGVGVDHHERTVAGRLAGLLAQQHGRTVAWTVLARSGATAAGVRAIAAGGDAAAVLAGADVVVVSVGVNDVTGLRSDRRWRADLRDLLDLVLARAPRADVVLLGVPPMQRFPAMPRALGRLMGARARRLDAIGQAVVGDRPRVRRLALADALEESLATAGVDAFAGDGFHPSAAVHDRLALEVAALLGHPVT